MGGLLPPSAVEEENASTSGRGVIFVLENASLETAKVGKVCPPPSLGVKNSLPAESI